MAKKRKRKMSQGTKGREDRAKQAYFNELLEVWQGFELQMKSLPDSFPDMLSPELQRAIVEGRALARTRDVEAFGKVIEKVLKGIAELPDVLVQIDPEQEVGDSEMTLTTPAGRALLASFDEAYEDRLDLFLNAVLEADPDSVETLVLLGNHADSASEQLQWYVRASDAASRKNADDVAKAMPPLRRKMLQRLCDSGQLSDAVMIAAPGLTEDPRDEQQLRFLLTDIYLQLGWHDELYELIAQYINDDVGVIAFARALLAFRENGADEGANAYLLDAHASYPGVAEFLSGVKPMSSGQQVETQGIEAGEAVAEMLIRGWKDTDGAAAWVRQTLANELVPSEEGEEESFPKDLPWLRSCLDPFRDAMDIGPGEGEWRLVLHKNGTGSAAHTLAVMADDILVYARPFDHKPNTAELRDSVMRSIADPLIGEPRKPRCIMVGSKVLHNAVAKICLNVNVDCRIEKLSAADQKSWKQMMEHLALELQRITESEQEGEPEGRLQFDPTRLDTWLADFAAEVSSIPVSDEHWLINVVRPPQFITDGNVPDRLWLMILLDAEFGRILNSNVLDRAPSIWETLEFIYSTMLRSTFGSSRRPANIIAATNFLQDSSSDWSSTLEETEIQIKSDDNVQMLSEYLIPGPPMVDDVFTEVVADLLEIDGPIQSQLRQLDGIDDAFLKEFYHRAAVFYRTKPWKLIQRDRPFFVTCKDWERSSWACFIMGQLGQQLGLNLFDDLDDARAIATEYDSRRYLNAAAIQYDEAHGGIPADVWNIERMGWEIASEQAYPFIVRMENGSRFVSVTSEDLRVLNDILPHIPRFLDHPEDQPFEVTESCKQIQFGWN